MGNVYGKVRTLQLSEAGKNRVREQISTTTTSTSATTTHTIAKNDNFFHCKVVGALTEAV